MLTRKMFATSFAPPRIGSVGPVPINSQFTLTVDWTAYIVQTGETISTSTWAVAYNTLAGSAVTLTNPTLTGSVATVQALCSAEGVNIVQNTVTFTDGNVEIREWRIQCLSSQP